MLYYLVALSTYLYNHHICSSKIYSVTLEPSSRSTTFIMNHHGNLRNEDCSVTFYLQLLFATKLRLTGTLKQGFFHCYQKLIREYLSCLLIYNHSKYAWYRQTSHYIVLAKYHNEKCPKTAFHLYTVASSIACPQAIEQITNCCSKFQGGVICFI